MKVYKLKYNNKELKILANIDIDEDKKVYFVILPYDNQMDCEIEPIFCYCSSVKEAKNLLLKTLDKLYPNRREIKGE